MVATFSWKKSRNLKQRKLGDIERAKEPVNGGE